MITTHPDTHAKTIHCDACGEAPPIVAVEGRDPEALLLERTQGWQAKDGKHLCPRCRGRTK